MVIVDIRKIKMEEEINKIQEDYMYKNFGIIPNHIYNFQFSSGSNINGIIMNFDANTFCVRGVKGMYIVKRSELDSMYPSKISKDKWEESRVKYLESFIETQYKLKGGLLNYESKV